MFLNQMQRCRPRSCVNLIGTWTLCESSGCWVEFIHTAESWCHSAQSTHLLPWIQFSCSTLDTLVDSSSLNMSHVLVDISSLNMSHVLVDISSLNMSHILVDISSLNMSHILVDISSLNMSHRLVDISSLNMSHRLVDISSLNMSHRLVDISSLNMSHMFLTSGKVRNQIKKWQLKVFEKWSEHIQSRVLLRVFSNIWFDIDRCWLLIHSELLLDDYMRDRGCSLLV